MSPMSPARPFRRTTSSSRRPCFTPCYILNKQLNNHIIQNYISLNKEQEEQESHEPTRQGGGGKGKTKKGRGLKNLILCFQWGELKDEEKKKREKGGATFYFLRQARYRRRLTRNAHYRYRKETASGIEISLPSLF